LFRESNVGLQNLRFKIGGRLRPSGAAFAALTILAVLFTTHSGVIRCHAWLGERDFEKAAAPQEMVLAGVDVWQSLNPEARAAVLRSQERIEFSERWGLVSVVENQIKLAWLDLLQGRRESAADHLRRAAAKAPDDPFPPYHLGRVYMLLGRPDAAIAAFGESLAADPDMPESRFHLGNTLAMIGDLNGAMRHWIRLADSPPPEALKTDRFEGHERVALHQALRQQAQHNLGGALAQLGRFDEAAARFEQALKLNPADAETHMLYSLVLRQLNRTPEADEHAARAAELDPRFRSP
jgi:tetratricopeptide (TPR) repeat protein